MIDAAVFLTEPPTISQEDQAYHLQWTVPAELPYFDGHFPDMPILPAVAIIDASFCFLGAALHNPQIILNDVRSCKITGVVTPGLALELSLTVNGPQARMLWKRRDDGTTVCDVNFSYL